MKKNRLFFMFAALLVAAAVMFSCQKEEGVNFDNEVMLKAAYSADACQTNCINNTTTDFWYQTGTATGAIGANTKSISYSVHNTKDAVIVKLTYTRSTGSNNPTVAVTVGALAPQQAVLTQGTEKTFTFPMTITTTPCVEVTWSFTEVQVGGTKYFDGQNPITASGTYNLIPLCPTGCDDEFTLEDVSACGETERYAEFLFVAGEDGEVKIQGGLTNGATETTSEVWLNGVEVGELTYGVTAAHVHNWIGTLEECDEVVIKIWWSAPNEEIIDSWTVVRAESVVGMTEPVECDVE